MIKIWGIRNSLIGDTVMSLPSLNILRRLYPESYIIFSILRKCSQAAPIYFNHPLIDRVKISDTMDGYGDYDKQIIDQCEVVIDCMPHRMNALPDHLIQEMIDLGMKDLKELDGNDEASQELKDAVTKENLWYNYYSCIENTVRMARISLDLYHQLPDEEKLPRLYRWWDTAKYGKKHIAIWPFSAYGGGDGSRNPSEDQWKKMISMLIKSKYHVHHFGWYQEPILSKSKCYYHNHTKKPFFTQIQETLNCNKMVGCDSGSSWVIAAYGEIPQINLLSPRLAHGHFKNLDAFNPVGPRTLGVLLDWPWSFNLEQVVGIIKDI